MKNRKLIFKFTLIFGAGLFVFLIIKIGPINILENFNKLTWEHLFILFFLRFIYWITRTFIWSQICQYYQESYSFFNLFSARMAGHAVSYLTPASYLGGEIFRTLSVSSLNKKKVLASVIVDKTIEILSALSLVVLSVWVAFFRISLPMRFKYFLGLGILFMVLLMGFLFLKQKKGLLTWVVRVLQKINLKFSFIEKRENKIKETDDYVSGFYRKNKMMFFKVFSFYLILHLYWVSEIYLTMIFISGEKVDFFKCFLIVTLGTIVFFLPNIPASLGTYEATYVGLFVLMGFSADLGISVTLIRRILALFWAGFGLLIIGTKKAPKEITG